MQLHDPVNCAIAAPSIRAVLLAGRIRAAHRLDSLEVHMLSLPMGRQGSLLDSWLAVLAGLPNLREVQVIVNSEAEAESIRASMSESHLQSPTVPVQVIAEPASWRGAAGIIRDVTTGLGPDDLVLVCEAKRLPPPSLQPLLEANFSRPNVSGVVGLCASNDPAGVYLFGSPALQLIPRIGYFDLKEQFLPAIVEAGRRIVTAPLGDSAMRINDLESYLAAVRATMLGPACGPPCASAASLIRSSAHASISSSASLDGCCIVEAGAVIEDGAVVHDCVVLWGATIGGGTVISRSVVGPLASIEPRSRIVRELIVRPASHISGGFNQRRFTAALVAQ